MNASPRIVRTLAPACGVALLALAAACGGGGGGGTAPGGSGPVPGPSAPPSVSPTSIPTSAPSAAPSLGPTAAPMPAQLILGSAGFYGELIATRITAPRQLVALANGDLLVGSNDNRNVVYIVPNADGPGAADPPAVFVTLANGTAQGIAVDGGETNVYAATNQSVWKIPYKSGDRAEPTPAVEVAKVRRGGIGTPNDGDVHYTTSVAVVGSSLYAGVGSSCNACVENDPTRATIQRVDLTTLAQSSAAVRFRNPLALAVNPATNTLWAGGAGQDGLQPMRGSTVLGVYDPKAGHPYEFFDPVTSHAGVPDYGWPDCEENDHLYNPLGTPGASCTSTTNPAQAVVQPAVAFLAYSTVIGATFYPANQGGKYAFPAAFRGGAFVSMHGSWHEDPNGRPLAQPDVAFVPMSGDLPARAVDWNDSTAQWSSFLYGFQTSLGTRIGRPVGLAVGPQGSLFIADDFAGAIYRIRPGRGPAAASHRRAR